LLKQKAIEEGAPEQYEITYCHHKNKENYPLNNNTYKYICKQDNEPVFIITSLPITQSIYDILQTTTTYIPEQIIQIPMGTNGDNGSEQTITNKKNFKFQDGCHYRAQYNMIIIEIIGPFAGPILKKKISFKITHNLKTANFTICKEGSYIPYENISSESIFEIDFALFPRNELRASYLLVTFNEIPEPIKLGPYVIITKEVNYFGKAQYLCIEMILNLKEDVDSNISKDTILEIIKRTLINTTKVKPKFGVIKRVPTAKDLIYIFTTMFHNPLFPKTENNESSRNFTIRKNLLGEPCKNFSNLLHTLHSYDNSGYWNKGLLHLIDKFDAETTITTPGDAILRFSMQTGALAYAMRNEDRTCKHFHLSDVSDSQLLAQRLLENPLVKYLIILENGALAHIGKYDALKLFISKTSRVTTPINYNDFLTS